MNNYRFEDMLEDIKANSDEHEKETAEVSTELAKIIGEITNARIKQNLSQRQLSQKCGIKQSAIARMESLQVVPRIDTILKIAHHLNLKLNLIARNEQNINISIVVIPTMAKNKYSYTNHSTLDISSDLNKKELAYGTIS